MGKRFRALEFMQQAAVSETDECIDWPFAVTRKGYGLISRRNYGQSIAHRKVWELRNKKPFPAGQQSRHTCNNRKCVNPRHIVPGTNTENQADRIGNGTTNRGERSGHAKLTEDDVRDIRKRFSAGENQLQIAAKYSISKSNVYMVATRRRWKHLD